MTRIICYIPQHRLEQVKSAIAALGVSGMSVTDARGCGNSPERSAWLTGDDSVVALPLRARVEVVAPDDIVEPIIASILESARTGEPGDGKIFIEPIEDAIRIRTCERGNDAI